MNDTETFAALISAVAVAQVQADAIAERAESLSTELLSLLESLPAEVVRAAQAGLRGAQRDAASSAPPQIVLGPITVDLSDGELGVRQTKS